MPKNLGTAQEVSSSADPALGVTRRFPPPWSSWNKKSLDRGFGQNKLKAVLPPSSVRGTQQERRVGSRKPRGALRGFFILASLIMLARRFPPPWSVEVTPNCFIMRDANGQAAFT
jgi:hypothetical protein